jgi:CBS domain-containing protein
MSAKGREALEGRLQVREVMTRDPVTVSPRMRLDHAASLMKEDDVSSLIVVRKGVPVGIVTENDFVEKVVAKNLKPGHLSVKDIMNAPLITVSPGIEITDAARTMCSLRIHRLAVLEDGKLVGIVTESDILKISPELIDITREFEKINRTAPRIGAPVLAMGICEGCQSFSEELREKDGIHLCKFCIEELD